MRTSTPGQDLTFDANADLSAKQFFAMKLTTTLTGNTRGAVTTSGAGERSIGILQNKPNAQGIGAVIRISGTSKMCVDGNASAIVAGDPLKADGAGKGVKAGTDKDKALAVAMEASTADGDIIEVFVRPFDVAV